MNMTPYVSPSFAIPESLAEDLEKLGALLDASARIKEYGQELFEKHLMGKIADSQYRIVGYLLFAKGYKTLLTVQNLCRVGCGSDGLALCATLFENYIDLAYIGRDPDPRSRMYVQYEFVEKYLQAKKLLRHNSLEDELRKYFRERMVELEPRASGLLAQYPNPSKGWAQRTIRERATEIGKELEYDLFYWIFCTQKHTQPAGITAFVVGDESGTDVVRGPSMKGVAHAAFWSSMYFLRLCAAFEPVYGLHIKERISQLSQELVAASEETRKAHPEICA